ncbi:hypothetical protein [Streptomyces roseolus]|uniref:hypothetical protein n=1 Tax=Streptomyces roseolus TaxID=67358 RepID=UPI0016726421|nr:hypothetical protein [Streptomyces roseolus]GGR25352.1 hypothetical protein GCM10010282_17230 [Streptomyces roseolus]
MDDSLTFESFWAGAKKSAHKAMDDHARGEYDEFALHAGVSVERLCKAVLVSKNPIYIAEMKGSAEMLFHLGGHRVASKVRTIGAAEAIARLRTLNVLPVDRTLDLLIDLRNGVAHASTGNQAKGLLSTLAAAVAALHEELDQPLNSFWERWTESARVAIDQAASKVHRDVQVRISQALHRFNDRFEGLPDEARDLIVRAQMSPYNEELPVTLDDGRRVVLRLVGTDCPACTSKASVFFDEQAESPNALLMVPRSLKCFTCGLTLDTLDEVHASGVHVKPLMFPSREYVAAEFGETHQG